MTEHMAADLSPAALEILLLEWWPLSADEYAAAFRYQDLLHCMKELQSMFEMRHKDLIRMIQEEELVSKEFMIEIPTDTEVDKDLLRDELPDVYDELVFIKPSDAKRFLGLKTLYDLSVETAGYERVGKVERVNLLDLRKALPAPEAERYMKEVPHESLTRVARRGRGEPIGSRSVDAGCSEDAVRTAAQRHKLRKPVIIMSDELRRKLDL